MNWKHFVVVAFALLVAMSLGSTRLAAQTANTGDISRNGNGSERRLGPRREGRS